MKTKIIALTVAFAATFTAQAYNTETVDGIEWKYTVSDGEATVGNGYSPYRAVPVETAGEITVPSTLGGYPVTAVRSYAFEDCTSLTGVRIPIGVTSVGGLAFNGCSSLTNVTIPASVTSIGGSAFRDCISLERITLPASVECIKYYMFEGCTSLKSVTIPASVTDIENNAFQDCTSLKNITIPASVENIGSDAFYGCISLESISIPASVTRIEQRTFYGCSSLKKVVIPVSVSSIEYEAFYDCSALEDLTIPDGLTYISSSAFDGCTSLKDENGFQIIGKCLYAYLGDATEVVVPDSVTSIGDEAFSGCESLVSITIPDSVTSIGYDAFYECRSLKTLKLPKKLDFDEDDEYRELYFCGLFSVTEIVVPEGVFTASFECCTNLISISFPESFMKLGEWEGDGELSGCFNLERVSFAGRPPVFSWYDYWIDPGSLSFLSLCMYADSIWYTEKYEKEWRKVLRNIGYGGVHGLIGTDGKTTVVGGGGDARYDLADGQRDRAIASVEVTRNTALDPFVLKDGKVYDCVLRVVNTSASEVKVTLPTGYRYETFGGMSPLKLPPKSTNLLTVTRTAEKVFLVTSQPLKEVR